MRAVAKRRQFSAAYKLAVLAEADRASDPGRSGRYCAASGCTARTCRCGGASATRGRWVAGVAASFSRPRVSNDNPFSEAQFKTLKFRPEFPGRFDSIEHARAFLRTFFAWYNDEHRHSGIGFMTPAAVHFGTAPALWQQRAEVLQAAYAAHPERFKGRFPLPPKLPKIVGINLPKTTSPETTDDLTTTPALLTKFQTEVSHSH